MGIQKTWKSVLTDIQTVRKKLLLWRNYVLNYWIKLTLFTLYCFLCLITLPSTEILPQPQHHHFIGLDMATCILLYYTCRAVTGFFRGDVQKVAGESSCCSLVNNLFLCQRSPGATRNFEFPGEISSPALDDSPERAC